MYGEVFLSIVDSDASTREKQKHNHRIDVLNGLLNEPSSSAFHQVDFFYFRTRLVIDYSCSAKNKHLSAVQKEVPACIIDRLAWLCDLSSRSGLHFATRFS